MQIPQAPGIIAVGKYLSASSIISCNWQRAVSVFFGLLAWWGLLSNGTLAPPRLCKAGVTTAWLGHYSGHRNPGNPGGSQSWSGPHFHLHCNINAEAVPALSPARHHSQGTADPAPSSRPSAAPGSVQKYLALFRCAAMVTQAPLTAQVSLEEL